jgi:D-alanine-D-alanine ligase-like ATP-grasp enzyme/acylphosphatase
MEATLEATEYKWLAHHKNAVPRAGQGQQISVYTIALEGWRRGLDLKFYSTFDEENKLKLRYSLTLQDRTHHFSLSMGDKVSDFAFRICEDKQLTKQWLVESNVPVPLGKMFKAHIDDKEIISYSESVGFPLVVKPTNGNGGRGVFANIQNPADLKSILVHVREELGYPDVIVENYIPGEEFRICVIEDRVLGAMNRRPASVVGDGIHTITQLIYKKNQVRKMNPHLTSRLIKIDKEVEDLLKRDGYTLTTIPKENDRVFLREKSNLSAGGDAIDVTDELTPELKEIAINAGKAIPGLAHFGVDMIVNRESNTGVILEVNARPGIGGHLFPMEGQSRDFAKDIIDYYFPETLNMERSSLYFDFDSILEPIKNRNAKNVEVTAPPLGKMYGKKYIVSGKVQATGYEVWVKKQAIKRNLHGFTETLDNGTVVVIVAGIDENTVNDFYDVCYQGPERAEVEKVTMTIWEKPLKFGFEMKKKELSQKELREIENEIKQIEKDRNYFYKKYTQVLNSRMWRYTSPVRTILDIVKNGLKMAK